MDVIITNGTLVTPWESIDGVTLGIEGEKIAFVQQNGTPPKAKRVIDAQNNHILPGIIDCHTHFGAFLPYEDDVMSETKAAAVGGVTTVFHVILEQGSIHDRIPYYLGTTERLATVDMSFWAACMTENHLEEIEKCRERGVKGFKFFMAYKGDEMKKVGISGIELKECPNCGSVSFFVDDKERGMIFFNVTIQGTPITTKPPQKALTDIDMTMIHCTSCAWYGSVSELTE